MQGAITANLGGKIRTFKFGTNSTAKYCEERNCNLSDYMEDVAGILLHGANDIDSDIKKAININGSEIRDLIYSGLWAFDVVNNNEIDYTKFNVGEWIDEADQNDLNGILKELFSSNEGKVTPQEQEEAEGEKKK